MLMLCCCCAACALPGHAACALLVCYLQFWQAGLLSLAPDGAHQHALLLTTAIRCTPVSQSEAHRPLLPYLLLSGLEHPANVARFTPQMLRDAGAH